MAIVPRREEQMLPSHLRAPAVEGRESQKKDLGQETNETKNKKVGDPSFLPECPQTRMSSGLYSGRLRGTKGSASRAARGQ